MTLIISYGIFKRVSSYLIFDIRTGEFWKHDDSASGGDWELHGRFRIQGEQLCDIFQKME